MNPIPDSYDVVFRSPRRDACLEARLVLESVGITNQVIQHRSEWLLVVAGDDFRTAAHELAAYRDDNAATEQTKPGRIRLFGGAFTGVFVYACFLIAIGVVSGSAESKPIWNSIGRMQSGQVMTGQLYRCVTALTLHADAVHLMSNLGYGALFGLLAGRILGGGVAWLTIVLAGSLGNFLNALFRNQDHASIGASTAVFAALGIMVAHALRPRSSLTEPILKRWSPLIGGVLLLAFTGIGGERTDVGAHVAGFVAGCVLGWIASRLPTNWLGDWHFQTIAGSLAIAFVIAAWSVAIYSA